MPSFPGQAYQMAPNLTCGFICEKLSAVTIGSKAKLLFVIKALCFLKAGKKKIVLGLLEMLVFEFSISQIGS